MDSERRTDHLAFRGYERAAHDLLRMRPKIALPTHQVRLLRA